MRIGFLLAMRERRAFLTDIAVVSGTPEAQHVGPCLATRAIPAPLLEKGVLFLEHNINLNPETQKYTCAAECVKYRTIIKRLDESLI